MLVLYYVGGFLTHFPTVAFFPGTGNTESFHRLCFHYDKIQDCSTPQLNVCFTTSSKSTTSESFILGSYLTYSCKLSLLSEIQRQDFHISSLILRDIHSADRT